MIETWYVMENGSACDPRNVTRDSAGVLRSRDGRAVAYRPDGVTPRSRGVDIAAEREAAVSRELTADEPKRGYKTRETKAR